MHELVADGLRLGALGFSTDQVVGNIGPANTPLPGQVCDDAELLAVAHALGNGPGPGVFTMAPRALLLDREHRLEDLVWHEQLAATSGKPVVIGPVFDTFDDPGIGRDLLDAMAAAQARGHRVVGQVSPRPFELWTRLDAPGVLVRVLPTLHAAVKDGGAEGVRRLTTDPGRMETLRAEGAHIRPSLIFSGRWDHVHVRYTPRSGDLRDRDLATISSARGEDPTDLLIDIALNDDFETQFAIAMRSPDDGRLGELVAHPAAQLGGSDAGAHAEQHRQLLRGVDVAALGPRARSAVARDRDRDAHRPPGRACSASATAAGSPPACTPTSCSSTPTASGSTTCATCPTCRPAERDSSPSRSASRRAS